MNDTPDNLNADTLTINSGAIEAKMLFDAYIEGFKQSAEGNNAEYPYSWDEGRIRDDLEESFQEWVVEYAGSEIL